MSLRLKTFAEGRLGDTSGQPARPLNVLYEIYRVPQGKSVIVKAMRFVNNSSATVPMTVLLRSGSLDDRPLVSKDLYLKNGLMLILDEELALGAGDAIWAKVGKDLDPFNANYTDKIDYVLSGVERDVQS